MDSRARVAPPRDAEVEMTPEQWQRVNDLFYAALERDPDQRLEFLLQSCVDDVEILREVESLLAAHHRADTLTGGQVFQKAVRVIADEEPDSIAGNRIGPYRIIREIGRGGMGAVYLAERDDDEYQKQVAIKLIKRGMDSDAILHRFLSERQILARLDHANIARLLDGGTTTDGRPYFVMEYIEGQPIDRYADERKLSITERLALFLEVAAAVEHSHQHLVVHRDIKPSNIIVTSGGSPRLLDFGIAKIVTPETGIAETRSAKGWMTPEYSSPEQLRGEAITTATDVYSLGVVLYELLTGRSPYRFENRSPAELAELISSDDPQRPSTAAVRISPVTARDDAPTQISPDVISEFRDATPEKLRRRLSGDLDNIVLMAMNKEKESRYASVAALADDIRRHLEGRTVMARKATFAYRASKFIRRNKISVAAAALIALTLIGSSILTAWQARRARQAQAQAERSFNDMRFLAQSVFFNYHDRISDLPGSTPVREQIVSDTLDYLNSLAERGNQDPLLQAEIANAYEKLSSIQGGRGLANLGDTAGAVESLRKCLQIRQSLLAANPGDSDIRLSAAIALRNLAELLGQRGDREGAAESYHNAVSMSEALLSIDATKTEFLYQAAISYGSLGDFLIARGDWKGALENEEKALALFKSIPRDHPQIEEIDRSIGINHLLSGMAMKGLNDLAGAGESHSRAIEIFTALSRKDPTNADYRRMIAASYYYQGGALKAWGRLADALASFRRYAEIAEEVSAADPQDATSLLDRATAYSGIGAILLKTSQNSEALSYIRRSLDISRPVYDRDPDDLDKLMILIEGMGLMSKALAQAGNIQAAVDESRKAMTVLARADENSERADLRGTCALALRNIAEAFEAAARSSTGQRKRMGEEARAQYQRSLDILLDMQSKGTLSSSDAPLIEEARQGIARCELLIR